jgi:hypothetical protein
MMMDVTGTLAVAAAAAAATAAAAGAGYAVGVLARELALRCVALLPCEVYAILDGECAWLSTGCMQH